MSNEDKYLGLYLETQQKYFELLYAVQRKFPGETRHETALRYIREAENFVSEPSVEEPCKGKSGNET